MKNENSDTNSTSKPKAKKGFASWSPERLLEAARRGGKAAHAAGTAHEFSSEEARVAGRKGAAISHANAKARRAKAATP